METLTERYLVDVAIGMVARTHDLDIETARRRLRDDAKRTLISEAQLAWKMIFDHMLRIGRWQGRREK